MTKLKPWLENNNVMIGFFITFTALMFWIFNIYGTGVTNANNNADMKAHQLIHCVKIQEREVFDARLETKLDVLLQVYGIDPAQVKTNTAYLSAARSVAPKVTEADKIAVKKYIEELQLTYKQNEND